MNGKETFLHLAEYCAGCFEIEPKTSTHSNGVAIICERAHSCRELATRIKASQRTETDSKHEIKQA